MDGPIVVGTDGSATATEAVLEATRLAGAFDQPLHIICAYRPELVSADGLPNEFAGSVTPHTRVESLLADVASRAKAAGVQVETHAVHGDAAHAILELADKLDAGAIVVGNKGIGSVRRFVLGNVPSKVVHHAPCSTYVVHTT
jgi:nucleotide-binding universal stress UspA family protein